MSGSKKDEMSDRFSDGGIMIAGDEVITDTEAEHYDAPSLVGTKRPPASPVDESTDDSDG